VRKALPLNLRPPTALLLGLVLTLTLSWFIRFILAFNSPGLRLLQSDMRDRNRRDFFAICYAYKMTLTPRLAMLGHARFARPLAAHCLERAVSENPRRLGRRASNCERQFSPPPAWRDQRPIPQPVPWRKFWSRRPMFELQARKEKSARPNPVHMQARRQLSAQQCHDARAKNNEGERTSR